MDEGIRVWLAILGPGERLIVPRCRAGAVRRIKGFEVQVNSDTLSIRRQEPQKTWSGKEDSNLRPLPPEDTEPRRTWCKCAKSLGERRT